jgi:hypothetical protein
MGLERGYCMMIGGEVEAVQRLDPIFARLAPGAGDIARTPGTREGQSAPRSKGISTAGRTAGHFVKMVHNGIEYGIMAAYAEGLGILRSANVGKRQEHTVDAETTPLRDPEHYQYDLNLSDIAEVWRRGSVIASWLLDLSASALIKDPNLEGSRVGVPTPARAAGPSRRVSTRPCRLPFSLRHSTTFSSRGGSGLCRQAAIGSPLRVWRAHGEGSGHMSATLSDAAGVLRRHGRPGLQEDLSVAPGDGKARPSDRGR